MSKNTNRDYLIIVDVKTSIIREFNKLEFYINDKESHNIFVQLVIKESHDIINKYVPIDDPNLYELAMNIVKPTNEHKRITGELISLEDGLYEFKLPKDCCDKVGTYKCELETKYNSRITNSNNIKYRIKKSVLNDLDDIVNAPEYPLVIQLFDKLSDIEQYEEDRRANELARQLAEEQRQTRFNALDNDMVDRITAMDDKMVDVENRVSAKEQAVDKLIVDTKADIDSYKEAKDQEIDEYKVLKDTEINNAITAQDDKIDTAINAQNDRIASVENNDVAQNNRLDTLENKDTMHESRMTAIEAKNVEQDNRLDAIEAIDVAQNTRLDAIEIKNQEQDDRLLDIEKVNKRQDMNLKCLFAESKNNMIDIAEEGNSIYLQNSTIGYTLIDEIKGNTLVNCNKEPNKELILNGNINTSGDNTVTLTEGVDGGLVDVSLEGNTLVNVSKTKDSTAISKAYTVENSGNHIALQGDIDGSCRPVITGNTLWIDNDTEEVLTAFDEIKNLRLQSTFEDNLVTQEMVDSGEEVADNLGKYKVDYKSTQVDGTVGNTKTLYLNSPLLEGDTIEEKDGGIYHVHRSNEIVLDGTQVINYLNSFDKDNTVFFHYSRPNVASDSSNKVYCDKLPCEINIDVYDKEGIRTNNTIQFRLNKTKFSSTNYQDELNTYLQQNPLTLVYGLATPTYELIEQSNLVIPSYANGYLDFNTAVPVEKVDFLPFSEELAYLYPSTSYTVQFISTRAILVDYYLGGTLLLSQPIIKGLNRISITTPSELADNKLTINGNDTGANIMEVIVTDIDRELIYFEGMKSVGEGKELQVISINSDKHLANTQQLTHEPLRAVGDAKDRYVLIDGKWYIERKCGIRAYQEGDEDNYKTDLVNTVYPLEMPTYEEIDYNPLEVYSGTTHISTNSTIPTNIIVKNHGYNCLLKPSTTYTISSNLGLNTVTTPSVLTEDCLRFMDTDTSDVTTMKDVLVLEGDWTSKADLIPANFSGIESAFEQEYDTEKGKYRVNIKVANEDKTKENNITFYINEPLRGVEDVKDRVYVKDDKVVVQRNCGSTVFDGSDDENWYIWETYNHIMRFALISNLNSVMHSYMSGYTGIMVDKFNRLMYSQNKAEEGFISHIQPTTKWVAIAINKSRLSTQDVAGFKQWLQANPVTIVYQLAEPTYEEVEYNDTKLFIESFKNSTLSYNSNVPVTSKLYYSYSVPIVDTVAQTANVTDQQDSMIIDLATQCAVMEIMLM